MHAFQVALYKEPSVPSGRNGKPTAYESLLKRVLEKTVIDFRSALERAMGDEDFFRELLTEFIQDLPNILKRLKKAIRDNDISTISKETRRLLGAAGNLGAMGLSDAAFELKQISHSGHTMQSSQAFKHLTSEADKLLCHVQTV